MCLLAGFWVLDGYGGFGSWILSIKTGLDFGEFLLYLGLVNEVLFDFVI